MGPMGGCGPDLKLAGGLGHGSIGAARTGPRRSSASNAAQARSDQRPMSGSLKTGPAMTIFRKASRIGGGIF